MAVLAHPPRHQRRRLRRRRPVGAHLHPGPAGNDGREPGGPAPDRRPRGRGPPFGEPQSRGPVRHPDGPRRTAPDQPGRPCPAGRGADRDAGAAAPDARKRAARRPRRDHPPAYRQPGFAAVADARGGAGRPRRTGRGPAQRDQAAGPHRVRPPGGPAVSDRVLIVDFGSQVTQLIARRVREAGVYSEVHPFNRVDRAFLADFAPIAVVLSGGPASVLSSAAPSAHPALFEAGVPVLGICYGQQVMAAQMGARVLSADHREFGRATVEAVADCALFEGVWEAGGRYPVWMSHGDRVETLPEGFRVAARSEAAPYAAIADESRRLYGVQFHPEVVHTPD
ncbi:MAG: glutamine-hydrolyzing GMP synthase, partial [Alphaproteobacteria bacterium]|nr:glutamine-hydrolyzing GMP synthase [Alphaproteobacteria bacterium]